MLFARRAAHSDLSSALDDNAVSRNCTPPQSSITTESLDSKLLPLPSVLFVLTGMPVPSSNAHELVVLDAGMLWTSLTRSAALRRVLRDFRTKQVKALTTTAPKKLATIKPVTTLRCCGCWLLKLLVGGAIVGAMFVVLLLVIWWDGNGFVRWPSDLYESGRAKKTIQCGIMTMCCGSGSQRRNRSLRSLSQQPYGDHDTRRFYIGQWVKTAKH